MSFSSYAAAGFGPELLPILPPDAEINPASPSAKNLAASRGKVPGKLGRGGWFGFADWTTCEASPQDHKQWSRWAAGVGLQGRKYPAVDIDIDREDLADAIVTEALLTFGLGPTRSSRAGRRLLVYAGAGIRKRRLAFRIPGGVAGAGAGRPVRDQVVPDGKGLDDLPAGPAENGGELYAVEILGDGQQYVVEGVHPKTGKPYAWAGGRSPAEYGADGLAPITAEEVDAFLEKVAWMVENLWDGEIVSSGGQGHEGGQRQGVSQDGLRAPGLGAVQEALDAIENDLDYDDWIRVMVMVKAATEGLEE